MRKVINFSNMWSDQQDSHSLVHVLEFQVCVVQYTTHTWNSKNIKTFEFLGRQRLVPNKGNTFKSPTTWYITTFKMWKQSDFENILCMMYMRKYLLKVVSHVNVITGIDPRKKKWFISQKDLRHIELQFSWGFLSFAATKGVTCHFFSHRSLSSHFLALNRLTSKLSSFCLSTFSYSSSATFWP